jgi:hypothetical protein
MKMRRLTTCSIALTVLLASATASALPEHLRVIWHENPAEQAIVSWSTEGPADTHIVWDDEDHPSAQEYAHEAHPQRSAQFVEDVATVYHDYTLRNLTPSTEVHFRIVTEEGVSRPYWFRTAPADARSFVLLYGGDSRSDSDARKAMNRRIRALVESEPSVVAFHHGGDYIMNGSSWPQWDRWLRDWQETVTSDGRVLPIIPARGNHEGDAVLYNKVFAFPGDPEAVGDWWVTRIGEDLALIVLDSNVSQAGAQQKWLESTLRDAQQYRWIIPSYHRPAYPAVKTPGGALYHWVPLFEQYNVDLVLESDGHVLKRTVPIREGHPDPSGVVYVGEGGLGVPQRTPRKDRWYLQPPGMSAAAHHVQALRVTPDAIYYSAVLEDGTVADTYVFRPKRRGKYAEPSVSDARLVGEAKFEVQFDRPVRPEAAKNKANYTFEPPVEIVGVDYDAAKKVATVRTKPLTREGTRLVIDGVVDDAGKALPRTAFLFQGVSGAEKPLSGTLVTSTQPSPTDQIRELPVGDRKPPRDPPLISCSQGSSPAGTGGLLAMVGLGLVLVVVTRRRP